MKLKERKEGISFVSDELQVHEFTMKVTGEAFSATVDNLYVDTIGSPPREYMANAFDAHRSIGSTKSFDVHAPTSLEPYFEVRDYGPGMDEEEILDRFISLFSSSKKNTNDEVGYFGLGCKAALTYTNAFSVTSTQDGFAQRYQILRQNGQLPQMIKGALTETDEPNGLTVRYNVQVHHLSDFADALRDICRNYHDLDIQPNIVNYTFEDNDIILQYNDVTIFKMLESAGRHSRWYFRMGAIAYPAPYGMSVPSFLDHFDVNIDVPIGTFQPQTSREALVVDDADELLMRTFISKAKDDIIAKLSEAALAEPTVIRMARHLEKSKIFGRQMSLASLTKNLTQRNMLYRGQIPTEAALEEMLYEDLDGINFDIAVRVSGINKAFPLNIFNRHIPHIKDWVRDNCPQRIFYTVLEEPGKYPRGMHNSARAAGYHYDSPTQAFFFFHTQEDVDKTMALFGDFADFVHVTKAERQAKEPATHDFFDVTSSSRPVREIDDIDEWLEDNPDFLWTTYSGTNGFYGDKSRSITRGAISEALDGLGHTGPVLGCTKTAAKRQPALTEDKFLLNIRLNFGIDDLATWVYAFVTGEQGPEPDYAVSIYRLMSISDDPKVSEYVSTIKKQGWDIVSAMYRIYAHLIKEQSNVTPV